MRVLVIGDMTYGRNSRSVRDGYEWAGHDVRSVDIAASTHARIGSRLWRSIRESGMVDETENARLRREIAAVTADFEPDLLLAVKTIRYDQSIMLEAPAAVRAHLSFDDVSNADNTTPAYLESEPAWDVVLTTKRHNVPELRARGVRDAYFLWGAFDPRFRRSATPLPNRPFTIGFIGASRPDRRDLPRRFASAAPRQGVVFGPRWRRDYPLGVRGVSLRGPAMGNAYTAAANSIQIGLVLLNSENRDLHTNRSIETPATGQMILAQRTSEHSELFEEGEEAFFFGSEEELWNQVRFLVSHPAEVVRVATNGYRKVTEGAFGYDDRAREFVAHLQES